jgi:hypothetical protein
MDCPINKKNKKENNNIYYFECYGKNIELDEFLSEFKNNEYKNKTIIYIKKDKELDVKGYNHIKVRSRKSFDYHINYNNIEEGAYINVSINFSDKDNSELKKTLEDIKNYILTIVSDEDIKPLYIDNPDKKNLNKNTFICKFIPDIESKKHRIYEIKEYLTKLLWNKDKFPFERVRKGYTELSDFKNQIIELNKKNQKLNIFPDFEPILRIQKKDNKNIIYLEYNIRQIYFVKPNIIPDPFF